MIRLQEKNEEKPQAEKTLISAAKFYGKYRQFINYFLKEIRFQTDQNVYPYIGKEKILHTPHKLNAKTPHVARQTTVSYHGNPWA